MAYHGDVKNQLSEVPMFGGKPLAVDLNPITLPKVSVLKVAEFLEKLLRDVEQLTQDLDTNRGELIRLGLPVNLDLTPTPLGLHIPFARFDCLFDGTNVQVLELNTDGTSGFNVNEWLATAAQLSAQENPNHDLSERLFRGLKEHRPNATAVTIADWSEVKTSWEQQDLVRRWSTKIPTRRMDPSYSDWSKEDLVYRRVLSWQLRAESDRCRAFLDAWKESKITVIGGWSSDVGMSKAWPALTKSQGVVKTWFIDEKASVAKDSREEWVLKAVLSYSGQGVFRGRDLRQDHWESLLSKAQHEHNQGRPWVLQKHAAIPLLDGKPWELGMYMINGKWAGTMARWGHSGSLSETSQEVLRPIKLV
ncbi:MAG: hypothetical protein IT289_00975 [Oligoflexia bacterium]|nr:hypothetical protein [Oligoflexia bacterium]